MEKLSELFCDDELMPYLFICGVYLIIGAILSSILIDTESVRLSDITVFAWPIAIPIFIIYKFIKNRR